MSKTSKGSNLFEQHLRLLEQGSASATGSPADREEAARVQALRVPPWPPPGHQRRVLAGMPLWQRFALWFTGIPGGRLTALTLSGVAAATCAVTLLLTLKWGDEVRFKGTASAWPTWRRGTQALDWGEGAIAKDGDRVGAEVTADRSATAFLGVYSRDRLLLSTPEMMVRNRLELMAGEHATFKGGFELTGTNEGETLAVVICEAAALPPDEVSMTKFVERFAARLKARDGIDAACVLQSFPLR